MDHAGFSDDITYSPSKSSDNFQCYLMAPAPTSLDWSAAYGNDACTKVICQRLMINKEPEWTKSELVKLNDEYRTHLTDRNIQLLHDKLIYYKLIFKKLRYIGLIIVQKNFVARYSVIIMLILVADLSKWMLFCLTKCLTLKSSMTI